MPITEQKFTSEIKKQKFAPAYLFHGSEQFLVEKYTDMLLQHALQPGDQDFNLDILYANDVEGSLIVNTALSFPMMADRRVLIVKNVHLLKDPGLKLLVSYLKKPADTTCLVLTTPSLNKKELKEISKLCETLECQPLKDYKVPEWIRDYLKENGFTITEDALRFLQGHTGSSMHTISSEIDKIRLNLKDKKMIDINDVEAVVGISKQYNVFELCDKIGNKDIAGSIHILNQLIQLGEPPGLIISNIHRHFIRLSTLKELKAGRKPDNEIASVLRVHPFFLKNYTRQANLFNTTQLKKTFSLLLETDDLLKSSRLKPIMLLELFILKLSAI